MSRSPSSNHHSQPRRRRSGFALGLLLMLIVQPALAALGTISPEMCGVGEALEADCCCAMEAPLESAGCCAAGGRDLTEPAVAPSSSSDGCGCEMRLPLPELPPAVPLLAHNALSEGVMQGALISARIPIRGDRGLIWGVDKDASLVASELRLRCVTEQGSSVRTLLSRGVIGLLAKLSVALL